MRVIVVRVSAVIFIAISFIGLAVAFLIAVLIAVLIVAIIATLLGVRVGPIPDTVRGLLP